MKSRKRLLLLALSLLLGLTGTVLGASPAQAAYSDCPAGVSCYWSGNNGTGTRWQAPGPGWQRLPFVVLSFYNRGLGTIYWYNGDTYTGWHSPVGDRGSNGALNATRVYIQP
ncbi:putative Peptidase inhibitor family I36 protein [Frankia sp. AiPs1]|uniref:peptidase inhibitor family I36 protein n=1 Tax=Frankia sp. AiPa1 TaxID=573492 RepID=UPI00202ACB7E|nr:peptidase inhibitor family I36 protein [Frankia sp. AiPa1]MCL9760884.1 peptidase inhibitor family I36 protein [Frankia sp. AiPa1]